MGNRIKILSLAEIREEHLKSNPLVILKIRGYEIPIVTELLPETGENSHPQYYFGSVKFPKVEIPDALLEKRVYFPGTGTVQALNINRRHKSNDMDSADLDREINAIVRIVENFNLKNKLN